jgi:metal-sulfur cluster biosynthetic enzyme
LDGLPLGAVVGPSTPAGAPGFDLAGSVRAAFRLVHDPELGLDLDTLGLFIEAEVAEGEPGRGTGIVVRMVFTSPFCPYGPALLDELEAHLDEALGLPFAIVVLSQAWSPSDEVKGLLGVPGYW